MPSRTLIGGLLEPGSDVLGDSVQRLKLLPEKVFSLVPHPTRVCPDSPTVCQTLGAEVEKPVSVLVGLTRASHSHPASPTWSRSDR